MYAGKRFAGLLYQAQDPQAFDQALLHPDWLRDIGAVGPEPGEPNPEEPTLEEHPEPLQVFPLLPRTPEELERHHGPAVPVPFFGVPSSRPAGAPPGGPGGPQSPTRSGPAAGSRGFPWGFPNPDAFAHFGRQLHAGLAAAGYPDVYAAMRGSAATGQSSRTGKPFDAGRRSDLDVALASGALFQRAKQLGIPLRAGGYRTRPLTESDEAQLGLLGLVVTLRARVGRDVSVMVYDSPNTIENRGANVPIPR